MSKACDQMAPSCKESNKLEEVTNLKEWKKRLDFVLEEHNVLQYVKGQISQLEDNDGKYKFIKGEAKAQIILFESLKDNLIPIVLELTTSKEVYDKLVNIYTINNTGQRISLWNKIPDVRMNKGESMVSFFMKITHIRDQLEGMCELVAESK